jgi:hypothetical protein
VSSFNLSHSVLVAVGAFYAFAGLVGLRASLQGRLIDIAIAGISMKPPAKAETARGLWLLVSSLVVLAGGLFLVLRLHWAAAAFVVSAAGQAIYLLLIAPKYFDRDDPPDATGRQQTINAFILYSAATLFVLWAYRTDKLMPPGAVGWPVVIAFLGVLGGATAYGLFRFFYPLAEGPFGSKSERDTNVDDGHSSEPSEDDIGSEPGPPLSDNRRILVMSEYQCDPLWTHDPGRSGTFSPRDLPLSEALIEDLEAWSRNYDTSFNLEDFNDPHWSEAQYAAHDMAGVALARRLKRELPDRQIFVWRTAAGGMGHVEITAED